MIIATAWDCPFDGPDTAAAGARHRDGGAARLGVDRIAIADTIGTTTPRRVSDLIAQVRPVIGDIPLGAHFHNTRGAGLASAYAAVQPRGHPTRLLGRRAGRLPVRAGRQRQHRHRGSRLPVARQRHRRRRRPAGGDRRRRRRAARRRPRPAERTAARRRPDPRRLAMPVETLTAKGRQTREAIEQAARKLFAERGFHGTTLADITSAAGKSPAVFYRYFDDKEDLLAALAESFLHDVVAPSGLSGAPAGVTGGQRVLHRRGDRLLEHVQAEHRHHDRRRAARPPPSRGSPPCRTSSAASAWTSSPRRCARPGAGLRCRPGSRPHRAGDRAAVRELHHGLPAADVRHSGSQISDEDAIATLSTIWKKTLYGF